MRLVYLSPVPWASFAQRPHKFVEWFHKRTDARVLWIDPYPTRLPELADFKHRPTPSREERQGLSDWISVVRPSALPIEPLPGLSLINKLVWSSTFLQVREFVGGHNALIAVGKPSLLANLLIREHVEIPSLYDAMDEFPAFYSGLSKAGMKKREIELVRKCRDLWVTSTRLKQHWVKMRPDLQLVPNGLEPALFVNVGRDERSETKKVFGYIGTIAKWFDWEWVVELAKARPNDTVRLIGPTYVPVPKSLPTNIELLPPCSHQQAIDAISRFNVGIIPFKDSPLTASVDPIKYYEYRAMGLPVISTDFGEMSLRFEAEGTFISRSLEDIEEQAVRALEHQDALEDVREFINDNSWARRFDRAKLSAENKSVAHSS
ncbi:glycosyl transferase [Rhizobium sp. 2MFCol3.1]|uniref:glycosyl transferase n=1 Tax=Rhizobium sp. 2MFCol3.1 TaxID=1246459 RepID=UPI0003A42B14|nr:glycosyl transferase [Rhizobium sp. 2MFCol3.1]